MKKQIPNSDNVRDFAPNPAYRTGRPTSFFVLIQRTKQEKSSQNDIQRALLQGKNFKQSGQASLQKFHALQHSQPRRLPVLAMQAHGALSNAGVSLKASKKQCFKNIT